MNQQICMLCAKFCRSGQESMRLAPVKGEHYRDLVIVKAAKLHYYVHLKFQKASFTKLHWNACRTYAGYEAQPLKP